MADQTQEDVETFKLEEVDLMKLQLQAVTIENLQLHLTRLQERLKAVSEERDAFHQQVQEKYTVGGTFELVGDIQADGTAKRRRVKHEAEA